MKKIVVFAILFFSCSKIFSQEQETLTEERSSAWIRIAAPATTVQKKTTTVRKKPVTTSTTSNKKSTPVQKEKTIAPAPKSTDEFNKTNSKVKRFQKEKQD